MNVNCIYNKSCLPKMEEISDNSVHLMVTSPPYNVGMGYNGYVDNMPMDDYKKMLLDIMKETYRVLVPGGRMCINIANLGRSPYIPIVSYVNIMATEQAGFLMRGEVIWNKGEATARGNFNCGTFCSPKNPVFRDCHEYILIFSKEKYDLDVRGFPDPDINATDFAQFSIALWNMTPSKISWHPASFPEELPDRLIQFFSCPGMIILDPFMGSGTTAVAAFKLKRKFLGYEMDEHYYKKAMDRLAGEGFNTFDPLGW